MIVSQTPYRVSYAGGGTDLPLYFRESPGAVLSTSIDLHIYVTLHKRFGDTTKISYSQIETVNKIQDIKHSIVREALVLAEIDEPIEITIIGDVPAGTGMGSSGSLTCGLLKALAEYRHRSLTTEAVARTACIIETEILGSNTGWQDQYAAAYGGTNYIQFNQDDTVQVEPLKANNTMAEISHRTLMFYTGKTRDASNTMATTEFNRDKLQEMARIATEMRDEIRANNIEGFESLLHEGWMLKRSTGTSTELVDDWYSKACAAGATGGKLLGAGQGGFLMLMADPSKHAAIRTALGSPVEIDMAIANHGSRIIFNNEK